MNNHKLVSECSRKFCALDDNYSSEHLTNLKRAHKPFLSFVFAVFLLLNFLFLFSCQKQTPSEIKSETRTLGDEGRLQSCTQVDLTSNVFEHGNSILLFQCLKWEKEFPNMYSALLKIEKEHWNHMAMPLNDFFLKNKANKDLFFQNIHSLDRRGGLDDLSYVINSLNETNFFDSTKELFECVREKDGGKKGRCTRDLQVVPTRDDLLLPLKLLETSPKILYSLSNTMKSLILILKKFETPFRNEVIKLIDHKDFRGLRLSLSSEVAKKLKSGLTELDRKMIYELLIASESIKSEDSEKIQFWLHHWFKDSSFDENTFEQLYTYPIKVNPNFHKNMIGIKRFYQQPMGCTVNGRRNPSFDLFVNEHLKNYVEIIENGSVEDFVQFSAKEIGILKLSESSCAELTKNQFDLNLIQFLVDHLELLSNESIYDLFRFVLKETRGESQIGATPDFENEMYVLDLFSGDLFNNVLKINSHIYSQSPSLYPLAFLMLKDLNEDFYANTSHTLKDLLKKENTNALMSISKLWIYLNDDERDFIYRFIDRHFKGSTQFLLLFDFYAKTFDDFGNILPHLHANWGSSKEIQIKTFDSIEGVLTKLQGKDILQEFEKFFSREHILKILEILSKGSQVNQEAKLVLDYLYADEYFKVVGQSNGRIKLQKELSQGSKKIDKNLIACLKWMSESRDFYYVLRNYQSASASSCQEHEEKVFTLQLISWLSEFDRDYLTSGQTDSRISRNDQIGSVLDGEGIFSPMMISQGVSWLKIVDEVFKQKNSESGFSYVLNTLKYYLYDFEFHDQSRLGVNSSSKSSSDKNDGINLLAGNAERFLEFAQKFQDRFEVYRNGIIREWTTTLSFDHSRNYISLFGKIIQSFSRYVSSGEYLRKLNEDKGEYDAKLSCKNSLDQLSGSYNCPNANQVKLHLKNILKNIVREVDQESESPAYYLIKSLKNGGGIKVPFDQKKQSNYVLSLKEGLLSVFDMSDRNLSVNRMPITMVNSKGQSYVATLTTMERIENVIRDVQFGKNYIGATYLNHVVAAEDYNDEVQSRKRLYSTCVKIPGIRCGKKMSDDDLRLARNSLETYDGLLDANNGRGLEPRLKYGKFLAAFQQALIASSSKKAQARQLLPIAEEHLEKHNGVILADLSMLAGYSNLGRYLRSRVSEDRTKFLDFINGIDFTRFENALLRDFDPKDASKKLQTIVNKSLNSYDKSKNNLPDRVVDWLVGLNDRELKIFEEVFFKTIAITTYLGEPREVFGASTSSAFNDRYKNNNFITTLDLVSKVIDFWPIIDGEFSKVSTGMSLVKAMSPFVDFYYRLLKDAQGPESIAYQFLNESFLLLSELLFEDKANQEFIAENQKSIKGEDFILPLLKDNKMIYDLLEIAKSNYSFAHSLIIKEKEPGQITSSLEALGNNVVKFISDQRVKGEEFRKYLAHTTLSTLCIKNSLECRYNVHYDEPFKLVRYFFSANENDSEKNEKERREFSKNTRFSKIAKQIFIERRSDFIDLVEGVVPCIVVVP